MTPRHPVASSRWTALGETGGAAGEMREAINAMLATVPERRVVGLPG